MKAISWQEFRTQASREPARIILADGDDPRVIEAAAIARSQHIADPILLSSSTPLEPDQWIRALTALPKYKTLAPSEALAKVKDPLIRGCLMLKAGLADGFIGGATRTTGDTLRAVFTIIGLAPKTSTLFGLFLIEARNGRFITLADCAVSPEPSPKQLSQIGVGAAQAHTFFTGDEAKVAFLSFSTQGSAQHASVDNVRLAVQMARERAPEMAIEGEWQADAALDSFSAQMKGVGTSLMAGQANVLVVPDLNCGNIAYKLIQRVGGCRTVGPILWGTAQPANDLSRGCSAEDIVDMLALTTLQARRTQSKRNPIHAH